MDEWRKDGLGAKRMLNRRKRKRQARKAKDRTGRLATLMRIPAEEKLQKYRKDERKERLAVTTDLNHSRWTWFVHTSRRFTGIYYVFFLAVFFGLAVIHSPNPTLESCRPARPGQEQTQIRKVEPKTYTTRKWVSYLQLDSPCTVMIL